MDNLKEMLESLNKETGNDKENINEEVAGMQKLFNEYKDAGGDCPDVKAFENDVVGFIKFKGFNGADIAKWDKEQGPESKEE